MISKASKNNVVPLRCGAAFVDCTDGGKDGRQNSCVFGDHCNCKAAGYTCSDTGKPGECLTAGQTHASTHARTHIGVHVHMVLGIIRRPEFSGIVSVSGG